MSNASLTNCILRNNTSQTGQGVIYLQDDSAISVNNSLIVDNYGNDAIFFFNKNMNTPSIIMNSVFSNNTSTSNMFNLQYSSLVIDNCNLTDNFAR
jgi:hypothetical protein